MSESNDILEAGHAVYPYMENILGTDAGTMKQELNELLSEAGKGEDVDIRIIELLRQHEKTRAWLRRFFEIEHDETSTRYAPLLGSSASVPPPIRYFCPICGYRWSQIEIGRKVPKCPIDNSELQRIPEPKKA